MHDFIYFPLPPYDPDPVYELASEPEPEPALDPA